MTAYISASRRVKKPLEPKKVVIKGPFGPALRWALTVHASSSKKQGDAANTPAYISKIRESVRASMKSTLILAIKAADTTSSEAIFAELGRQLGTLGDFESIGTALKQLSEQYNLLIVIINFGALKRGVMISVKLVSIMYFHNASLITDFSKDN